MAAQTYSSNQKPLWTQEEAIDFECARETIGRMIAICTDLIYQEKHKSNPDYNRITELDDKRTFFTHERLNLHLDEKEKITKIFNEYSPKIKAYFQDGPCPV